MLSFYLSAIDETIDKLNFEQIYMKFHDDILKRIYNILKNEEDAKDVMQNTWMSVLKNMSLFRNQDERAIRAYIMVIARNQSLSAIRKKRKEADLFIDMESIESVSDRDLFDICEIEGVSRVTNCINMLGDAQKEVIILYYLYHRSFKEIAKLLNVSETLVRSRWSHGRERLMTLLTERGVYAEK